MRYLREIGIGEDTFDAVKRNFLISDRVIVPRMFRQVARKCAVLGSDSITAVFYQTLPTGCLCAAERVSDHHRLSED